MDGVLNGSLSGIDFVIHSVKQSNICDRWKFNDDGSVKFYLKNGYIIKFPDGYPTNEKCFFTLLIKSKKKKGRFSSGNLSQEKSISIDIEAEELKIQQEEEEARQKARELKERKRVLAQKKASDSVKEKLDYLQKFLNEDKKNPEERDDVSITILLL